MTPMTRSPAMIGTPSQDSETGAFNLDGLGDKHVVVRADPERGPRLDDPRGESLTQLDRVGVEAFAFGELVREPDDPRRFVVEGDEERRRIEDIADAFADELDDLLEVQLLGERCADLVDDGQLRVALPRLLDGTGPHQRGPDVLRHEHEQVQVLARVAPILAIGLDGDDPDRPAIGLQRRARSIRRPSSR